MIKPGISELMKDMDSRYTLAMVVAKRARELSLDTTTPLVKVKSDKPVTIAVNEVAEGMIDVIRSDEPAVEIFTDTEQEENQDTLVVSTEE
ncbi:MAG: DNA-directed RNA polymerase subunit omega [Clostridia bacterium]|nr:DNA-directed RNA polymerase subunit omega [Oscillospiraceae bacterium]MBQ7032339.1 DNA-directed RNA polymerase subunit omega [Clostridia bacterium]